MQTKYKFKKMTSYLIDKAQTKLYIQNCTKLT